MCCVGSICMFLFVRYMHIYLYIFTHIYICIYILVCTYRRLLDQGTPFTHKNISCFPSLLHSRFSQGDPRRGQRYHRGRGTPDLKGLATYVEPWHVFLSSLPEKEIFALEHKAILGRGAFPSWKEANDSRGNMN